MKKTLIVACLALAVLAGAASASETLRFDPEAYSGSEGRADRGPAGVEEMLDPRDRRMRRVAHASKNETSGRTTRANGETDGSGTWTSMASPTGYWLECVWGSSGSDVFAVGEEGTILHYSGTSWTTMSSPTQSYLYGVWGSSGSNVFAVGEAGIILRYNGTSWTTMSSPTANALLSVWGSSGSDVFAVGNSGTILYFNGTSWSIMASGSGTISIEDVWGNSAGEVYAVQWELPDYTGALLKYSGSGWSSIVSGQVGWPLYGLWTGSSNDVFIVGDYGRIYRYLNGGLNLMNSGTVDGLEDVWGSSSSDVFTVGEDGAILHYNGASWSSMTSGTTNWLTGVWGSSATEVFAVGEDGIILHYTYVEPTILYVSSSGCGAKSPCYSTIQQAVSAAGAVSVIKIAGGTYTEFITLSAWKSLTLQGGWNSLFTSQNRKTTLTKAPKASKGSLTLQMLTIKP